MIGMSGDPPFVEHEQQACPLLFDNETDHYTQFVNRCFGNPSSPNSRRRTPPTPRAVAAELSPRSQITCRSPTSAPSVDASP